MFPSYCWNLNAQAYVWFIGLCGIISPLVGREISTFQDGSQIVNLRFGREVASEMDNTTSPAGKGCGPRFLQSALNENITNYCTDLLGMRMESFPPKKDDMIKINYDDKCFSKCYLTEIDYLNNSDNFDRTGIMNEIKNTTSQDKWSAVLKSTYRCIDSTEEMAKDEGGVSNSICKYSLIFFVCQREEEKRMTC